MSAIIFDTSGINGLEDDRETSDPIMRGVTSGFDVILTASTAEEIMATGTPERREALLSRLDWLLTSATCIWPTQEVIRLLISAHKSTPSGFDWRKVDVRARVYEYAISRRVIDDALSAEQRRHHFDVEKKFKKMWTGLRAGLDAIFASDPSKRPTSYQSAVAIAERDGGVLWSFGKWLYKPIAKAEPSEEEIKSFIEICPPFRAACYGLVMAWYNWSLRVQDGTATAGRILAGLQRRKTQAAVAARHGPAAGARIRISKRDGRAWHQSARLIKYPSIYLAGWRLRHSQHGKNHQ